MTTKPNYIGAVRDWDNDRIVVWERVGEQRTRRTFKVPYYFYVPDPSGGHVGLDGTHLTKLAFDTEGEYKDALRRYPVKYESDIQPLYKVLMNEYHDLPTPIVNFAFLDIEVDYSSKIGFAGPSNPYAVINAVTIYQSWTKQYKTYAIRPIQEDGSRWGGTVEDIEAEFRVLAEKGELRETDRPIIKLCSHELELLQALVEDIQDADIISGWNSEFFDLPYIVRRIELVAPQLLRKLCFIGCAPPRQKMVERFGTPEMIYSLSGRAHLDYLDLFKKFTFEGRTSYALGNILQEEIGLAKLHYEGTLEQLYKRDFPRFVAYNFRDVGGLVDLDGKFKFIQLVNQMAHENTCLFGDILGTVRYVETGIANRAHNVHGLIVPDKRIMTDGEKVEGALVLNPKIGLHKWIASVDINSLYPSVIRSLNISPEKYIGQFELGEVDWRGIMVEKDNRLHVLRFDDGECFEATGSEWRQTFIDQKWAISAYGTVFDQSSGLGLVPDTLAFWFAERKRLQAEKKRYSKLAKEEKDPVKKAEYERQAEHYDLLQLTKKIQLNSTYGALLNAAFRFGRKEMGASVTACGRQITTHMMETIHAILEPQEEMKLKKTTISDDDGVQHVYEATGSTILYGDTDSCYFKTHQDEREAAIRVADETADRTNASFPEFMRQSFGCQPSFDDLIKAGREVVAIRGLFQAKKKYVLRVIDLEGAAVDKLKSQGSEIKKADTPKIIQQFLKDLMGLLLDGKEYPEVEEFVNRRRVELLGSKSDIFTMGVAKQANNLDAFYAAWLRAGKPVGGKLSVSGSQPQAVPGHIRAAMNYNELLKTYDPGGKALKSGDKVIIFYLKPNSEGISSIAFPSDMAAFPAWFDEHFAVDRKLTEQKMIDNKLGGIFDALNWEVPTPQKSYFTKLLRF